MRTETAPVGTPEVVADGVRGEVVEVRPIAGGALNCVDDLISAVAANDAFGGEPFQQWHARRRCPVAMDSQ